MDMIHAAEAYARRMGTDLRRHRGRRRRADRRLANGRRQRADL